MRFSLGAVVLALACGASTPAVSQQAQAPLQGMARQFVEQVGALPTGEDRLARWRDHICPRSVGLPQWDAQRLAQRISARAQAVGLHVGGANCRANIMVIYARDPDALVRDLVDNRHDLFGYDNAAEVDHAALEAFAAPRAVRWWHVVHSAGARGQNLTDTRPGHATRDAVNIMRNQDGAAETRHADASAAMSRASLAGMRGVRATGRLRRSTPARLNYVLIVVDGRRVDAVPDTTWMDYVSMAALAQLNPDAHVRGYPTLLSLFDDPATAPSQLTPWDLAYLEGLYGSVQTGVRGQQAAIADRISTRAEAAQR